MYCDYLVSDHEAVNLSQVISHTTFKCCFYYHVTRLVLAHARKTRHGFVTSDVILQITMMHKTKLNNKYATQIVVTFLTTSILQQIVE